ncbi:MAG TPA: hypothetical protein VHN14_08015 [Kofleriaceae bacterium]|nr:hypothetical protein [Kofleriaceae bacterium]
MKPASTTASAGAGAHVDATDMLIATDGAHVDAIDGTIANARAHVDAASRLNTAILRTQAKAALTGPDGNPPLHTLQSPPPWPDQEQM